MLDVLEEHQIYMYMYVCVYVRCLTIRFNSHLSRLPLIFCDSVYSPVDHSICDRTNEYDRHLWYITMPDVDCIKLCDWPFEAF